MTPSEPGAGDRVRIAGVRGRGHHGVFPEERRDGQEFVVDLDLGVDLARPGRSDDLSHTINYAEVAERVLARIEGDPVDLIETLAESIAADVLARPLVEWVAVTVHKPEAPVGVPFGDVQVQVRRRRPPAPVVIAVGANLGDPRATVAAAVEQTRHRLGLTDVRVSPPYRTAPVGGPDGQPDYVNLVVLGRTRRAPAHVLRLLHEVEADFGREREIHWGARTLDLDLIQYGVPGAASEVRSDAPDLLLPHPRAAERAFVLAPWADVDPEAALRVGEGPVPVAELLAAVDRSGVERIADGPGADAPEGGAS